MTGSVEAKILKCTGLDNNGSALTIEYNSDPKAQSLMINGEIRKIEAPTKDKTGLATENFTTGQNLIVYDSFIKNPSGGYSLHRFNAMTDETIFDVGLVCKIAP
jgi:hypothetical protein